MKRLVILFAVTISLAAYAKVQTPSGSLPDKMTKEQELQNRIDSLQRELNKCADFYKVMEFSTKQDSTIFDTLYVHSISAIDSLLTQDQKDQLAVIRKISDLKVILDKVERDIQQKKEALVTQFSISDEQEQNQLISKAIASDVKRAGEILDELQKMDLTFLSSVQKGFYYSLYSRHSDLFDKYL